MSMVKVEAIIRPHILDEARIALQEVGVEGLTITEAQGFGRQKGHSETYRGDEYSIDFIPKIKLEVVCSEERKEEIIEALIRVCKTGKLGDGRIFVMPLTDSVRIRTGERGLNSAQSPVSR